MAPRLLLALLIAAPTLVAACDDDKKPPPPPPSGKRSEVVVSTSTAQATATPTQAHPVAPKAPRKICETPPASAGRSLPGGSLAHFEAPGTAPLPDKMPGAGRFTWVNLWAAWCGPCKEEIPRLKAWEAKLAQAGTPINLVFVSLDDDERQARRFLESQPANGLRASYWLAEGKGRAAWLEGLLIKNPQLPVQILADAKGQVRCVIDGAIEDGDFATVQAIVSKR